MNSITVVAAPSRGVAVSAVSTTPAPMMPPVQAQIGWPPIPRTSGSGSRSSSAATSMVSRAHQDREHRPVDRMPRRPGHPGVQERLHRQQRPHHHDGGADDPEHAVSPNCRRQRTAAMTIATSWSGSAVTPCAPSTSFSAFAARALV